MPSLPVRSRYGAAKVPVLLAVFHLLLGWNSLHADEFDPNWGNIGVFTQAQTCAACHRASIDQDPNVPAVMRNPLDDNGEDISPTHQWQHSMMAQGFNDPYFLAKVVDETTVFASLAGFIEDKCLSCHAPMGRTHAHQTLTDLTQDASCTLPDGCYRLDTASDQNHAREGVSCTLCHQIQDINLGTAASFSGEYSIAAAGDADAFTIYGPYQNPHAGGSTTMQNNSGYTPQFGDQVTSSDHCATCHTLFTPTIDVATGIPTGDTFMEQGPYLEWQNSLYATGNLKEKQCQDCHMPDPAPGAYSSRIAIRPTGTVNEIWPERSPFATHSMVGGNTYMLELLRDNRSALEIEDSTTVAGFDEKIAQTRHLLENETATLAITNTALAGNELAVDVLVTNQTGHKLPTSYPSRRMWIHLTVRDPANQVIFESGAVDQNGHLSTDASRLSADCLALTKPPGFDTTDCYEPHRDLIDDPSQVAIYETVLGDTNDDITHMLLHAKSYLKDNRIPPEGFTNNQADIIEPQTRPSGVDGDGDFNLVNNQEGSGTDAVHYRIAIPVLQNGDYTVEARLLYQALQPGFVDGMHTDDDRVNRFKAMVQQRPISVETIATDNAIQNVNPAPAAGGGGNNGGGGGGSCSIGDHSRFDPVLPALTLLALAFVGLRRGNRVPRD